ncbi:DUF4433 domain-containing protein [Frankia sp. AiPs1]|uniref:type II toxin-antitoxin system toxin DNA ADP-ribosyl transferase DarT n=1 Tax=Frankia sp. AiPs1 TaxID=573493 RepID=UPI00204488FE|nr:DUF4433 domain-containing protein [Frankia sp. AiPs1]MCM3922609.1 DUF4433 domain-containing protein [Frankia sp. AiPs1]
MHFTHIDHLATIMRLGLQSDTEVRRQGLLRTEVGDRGIKRKRRERRVPVPPGGVVADYVPFYFAACSPMMYVIHRGGVPTYNGGCDDLVYLVTTVRRIAELGLARVYTDRNAVRRSARFTIDDGELGSFIDWDLMQAKMWADTEAEPDRKERRMAECLVHERVPGVAFTEVVARTPDRERRARAVLATVGAKAGVVVRPDWYF